MKKSTSVLLSVLLIASLTMAAMGKIPWLWFWCIALLCFILGKVMARK
ncbi:MAG: hypothetical protein QF486_02580 [Candidatus Woesearchaeota archaeon]|jgi:hypothetical protein|nr:hypothetical protein [Candidatus Woesearchaeota archaeon]MDP7181439.1 hypothetical protein [Candidatus Woesearchaeota archaeon]MDP7198481.1 hypothetical protein [Candidatus Woesearchaeota archaeon]MDP7466777.1 hypothetical protein [Candidatus Woesearchaeota archaeon]MDP7648002.1 hypothetical protein [Candidatus Woesearchaeota archaeon]